MQKVLFPMKVLRVSQGYGLPVDGVSADTYSHTGSYALDLGGTDTGAEYVYAPCDVVVKRHYKGSGYNAVWFQTIEPVLCADGQQRELVFMFLHANDNVITELGITVGKTFAQGEKIYKEGTGGGVATHVHLEVGSAPFSGTGWTKSSYIDDRGANVWIINNKLIPSNIFFLEESTIVKDGYGYNWKYTSNSTEDPESYQEYTSPTKVRIIADSTKTNVEYFNTASVMDVAGGHLQTGAEYVAHGQTYDKDSHGWEYVKFQYSDGKDYWMVIASDRIEFFEYSPKVIVEHGVDVSDVQGGSIDWAAAKADGISFNINKIVGTNASYKIYVSEHFERNYNECKANGIKVGGYLYTYAFNEAEADDELAVLLPALKGKQFEYPIFVDVEDKLLYQNCSREQITATTKYLCSKIAEAGFYPAVYTYANFVKNYINIEELAEYDLWIADYDAPVDYAGEYTMWQYTSDGSVAGISGRVDRNYSYVDYESKIKALGMNGFAASGSEEEEGPVIPEPAPEPETPIEPTTSRKFDVRLKLRYDTLENWLANDPILLPGEAAIVLVPMSNGSYSGTYMKIGDGISKFSSLGFMMAEANVYDWAKQPEKPKYDISELDQNCTLVFYCGTSKEEK